MNTSMMKRAALSGAAMATLGMSSLFGAAPTTTKPASPAPGATDKKPTQTTPSENWSDRMFDEFQGMQRRMDRIFNDAMQDMHQPAGWTAENGFSSSAKLSEDQGNYIVHLSLPDRDLSKVDAKVEANNVLRVTAKEEKKEQTTSAPKDKNNKTPSSELFEMSRYEQLFTLPGAVDASKMKIDRSGSMVTITLPKAQ